VIIHNVAVGSVVVVVCVVVDLAVKEQSFSVSQDDLVIVAIVPVPIST
jgi:hypothetical protein